MAGSVTMTMVARAAGVSVSTVSHVVNGTRPVASATRQIVLEAMERLDFTHRPVARSLAAGSTTTIGLAISSLSTTYWPELVAGFQEEARRWNLQLLVADTAEDSVHEERAVANLLAHHIAGLVISPAPGWQETTLRLLREHPIPFVIVDRIQDVQADQVGVENETSSAAIVDHLLQRGHTRIAMITGLEGLSTTEERCAGYLRAHRHRRVEVDVSLMVLGGSSEAGGRRAMAELLARPDRPTAVFSASDSMTVGALRALSESDLRVPDDLALVAFDEFPWGDVFEPRLTTVAQPCFAIGARAIQMLRRRLEDPSVPPQTLRLSPEIMHRTSCGCR